MTKIITVKLSCPNIECENYNEVVVEVPNSIVSEGEDVRCNVCTNNLVRYIPEQ